jgi:NDP-sugar pyrophosphorylase family protein
MQAVILAAGLGKRLRPVTAERSKAMVPVLSRPLVERALLPLVENGIRDVVFVVSPEDREIEAYFRQQSALEITATFVVQHERLGMAHALGIAAPFISGRFMVSACDSLVDRSHVRELVGEGDAADAVLSLLEVEREALSRSAAVELDGILVRRIVEKPEPDEAPSLIASIPHYVFSPRLLEFLPQVKPSPRGEYEIQDAIQELIDAGGRAVGVRATERLQVSMPEDLLRLTRDLLVAASEPQIVEPASVGRGANLVEPLRIEEGVDIGEDCEVGPEVFLESGCQVGDGAVVRRSIVFRGGRVAAGETVEDRVVT